jgi:hypothetical protein
VSVVATGVPGVPAAAKPPDCAVVVFVGRLVGIKGPDIAVEAFALAANQTSGCMRLEVAGEGPMEATLRASAPAGTVFHGFVGNVSSLFRKAHVLLMPSRSEGLSVALLEAMSHGVVPVISDVGSQCSAAGPAGVCVPANSAASAFAAELSSLAETRGLLLRKSRTARARARSLFSLENMRGAFLRAVEHARPVPPRYAAHGTDLAGLLRAQNVPPRKTELGRRLAATCPEQPYSEWLGFAESARACDLSRPVAGFLLGAAGSQCGQWCVFIARTPDKGGIVYNGRCWEWFDRRHSCHQWTDLKARARAG